jgi:hypothetical protein
MDSYSSLTGLDGVRMMNWAATTNETERITMIRTSHRQQEQQPRFFFFGGGWAAGADGWAYWTGAAGGWLTSPPGVPVPDLAVTGRL